MPRKKRTAVKRRAASGSGRRPVRTDVLTGDVESDLARLQDLGSALDRTLETSLTALQRSRTELHEREQMLAGAHLDRLIDAQPGIRLKTLYREEADPHLRRLLAEHAERLLGTLVVKAISSREVSWQHKLTRTLHYAPNMDERAVELPLAFEVARFGEPGTILDAGAALNRPFMRALIGRPTARLIHLTQSSDTEPIVCEAGQVSYVFGDLRTLDFKDRAFDRILCISTLEHVGMDNTRYGGADEHAPESCRAAFRELIRALAPGGRLLVSVPYGAPTDFGWFRIFGPKDIAMLERLARPLPVRTKYYHYAGYWYEGSDRPSRPWTGRGEEDETIHGLAVLLIERPPAGRRRTRRADRRARPR